MNMAEINVNHINPFLMAAGTILRDACQMEMSIGKPYVKTTEFGEDSVIIMIGITGEMRGQVMIAMKITKACEIASKIRTYNRSSIIIITSSFKKYLIDGYKIEAKRYLIKPIDEKVFNIEMQSVLSTSFKQQYGFFDKKISQYKIHYKDMLYIEFLNRHTIIHFVNNIEKKTTYPLKHWIEKLSNKGFGQPYKSFLVNLDYVSGFSSDGKDIIMNNGEKIPLSKNFKKSFTNQYFANLHNIL